MTFIILVLFVSFIVSWATVKFYLEWATKRKILDIPNQRSSHVVPTPRGGGVGILLSFFVLFSILLVYLGFHQVLLAMLAPALVLAIVGGIDDLKGLPAVVRLLVHFLCMGVLLYVFLPPMMIVDFGESQISAYWPVFVFLAVVGVWMINVYNFMDGIDGFAAGQVFSVCMATGLLGLKFLDESGASGGSFLFIAGSFLLAGASLGFLVWNWPPAKIFMGDLGSGTLGFLLMGFAVWGMLSFGLSLVVFFILHAVFLGDATYTLIRRALRRQKIYQAHKDHLYQHLDQRGVGRKKIFGLLVGYNIVFLTPLAYFAQSQPSWSLVCMAAAYIPVLLAAWKFKAGLSL